MVTESKAKKFMDYSNSAVNLINPPEVIKELRSIKQLQAELAELQKQAESFIPKELTDKIASLSLIIGSEQEIIRAVIDQFGSYQDTTTGDYALKQRKVSVSYSATHFEARYPQYAPAVIIKAVDTTKLKGLIKGGLIKEEELGEHWPDAANNPIATETESFVYIVK